MISVDTKKKELVGSYKNGATDWRPKGPPFRVKVHDFEDQALGKVVPYGVYDVGANEGFVSLGITADTTPFAAEAIRSWIARIGRTLPKDARADDQGRLAAVPMARASGCGMSSCRSSPTKPGWRSTSTTIRRGTSK